MNGAEPSQNQTNRVDQTLAMGRQFRFSVRGWSANEQLMMNGFPEHLSTA